eukprot:scaffold118822_cov75-Phaeocystis_antarctica.AAC.4
MAMVAPNLTCAASRTHTRRAQHARVASGPSRHQTTHAAAAAMRAATQPDCLAPPRLICAHPPAAPTHQPNRPRLARRAWSLTPCSLLVCAGPAAVPWPRRCRA